MSKSKWFSALVIVGLLFAAAASTARAEGLASLSVTAMRQRARTKTVTGAVLVTAGLVLTTVLMATGIPLHLRDASRDEGSTRGRDLLIASVPAGTALFLAGMPLLVSGHDDRERARLTAQPVLVTVRY